MQGTRPHKRFNESIPGILAAILLAIVWIASMAAMDSHAYTAAPYLLALCPVILLWLVGILCGHKVVRLRTLSWLSLAAGGYFLWRCHTSYSVVEAWGESALILGCFVFYIAGVYAAQGESSRGIMITLTLALVANLALLFIQNSTTLDTIHFRPEYGVCGPTAGYNALFSYKNFAGFLLVTVGILPLCNLVFAEKRGIGTWLAVLPGLLAMGAAFTVGARGVFLLLPVLATMLWVMWLIAILTETRRVTLFFLISGFVLLVGGSIVVYDFLFGQTVVSLLMKTDTHLRGMAWELVCRYAPDAPLYGYGAKATQWEIAQYFNDWCTPNMAHNEYLQAWMDYGLIGLGLMVGIVLMHLVTGFRQLSSEHVSPVRQAKAGMALLYLLGSAICAGMDFGWHQAALATGTAFACGVLASPYPVRPWRWRELGRNWAPDSRPKPIPVHAQGLLGKLLLILVALGVGTDAALQGHRLMPAWVGSWQYHELMQTRKTDYAARRALLENMQPLYPDSALMDTYIQLPMANPVDWQRIERMLRTTLEANPKQSFTAVMLVDILGRQGRFEEAELLMRRFYRGDGPESTRTTNWGFYYAYNLLRWGQTKMYKGDFGTARSMLEHAFTITRHNSIAPGTEWRTGFKPWEKGETARFRTDIMQAAQNDLGLLRSMEIEPDDTWEQPMEKGGKPALYQRWKRKR